MMKRIFTICACATMLCSCYTSRILVGDVTPKEPMVEVSKKHDAHFIGGLVKTARNVAEEHVGKAENYMIRSQYGFGDIVLSAITAGIYTPTTTKYYMPVRHLDGFTPLKAFERPHKDNGLMLMTGVNFIASKNKGGVMADVVAGYKFMDHFVAGVGLGLGAGSRYLKIKDDKEGAYQDWNVLFDVMLRGRYLLFDKPSTPYVNLDLGMAISNKSYSYYSNAYSSYGMGDIEFKKDKRIIPSCVITPSVGYQFKVRNNVYLDAGLGYRLDTGLKAYKNYHDDPIGRIYSGGILIKFGVNLML